MRADSKDDDLSNYKMVDMIGGKIVYEVREQQEATRNGSGTVL